MQSVPLAQPGGEAWLAVLRKVGDSRLPADGVVGG